MKDFKLSDQERKDLLKLHQESKNKRQADRIKIILLLDKGYSQKEIAEILFLDEDTITKWKKRFLNRQTMSDWLSENYGLSTGKLSFSHLSQLKSYIKCFQVSNKGELLEFIQKTFQVNYTLSGVQRLLKRTGFSFKQLHRLPGGVDLSKQATFLANFEEVIAQPTTQQAIIFIDAVHPLHNSTCDKIWSEISEVRWIQSNTGRQRLHLNGAYNPHSQEVFIQNFKKIDAQSTLDLLNTITQHYAEKDEILVFADNARTNKCQLIKDYLAGQSKIKMIYLPPYSPNLNLIERLWKLMRQKTISTKFYASFAAFKKAILGFFENFEKYKEEAASLITCKFQTFGKT